MQAPIPPGGLPMGLPISQIRAVAKQAAPLFAWFAAFTRRAALDSGTNEVWLFTREGLFFGRALLAYQKGLGGRDVRPRTLHVSRMATFAASLGGQELALDFQRIWSQYGDQTVGDLLKSLGLPQDEALRLTEASQVALGAPARTMPLRDAVLAPALRAHIKRRRDQLLAYLAQRGFPTSGTAVVGDVGWRGTIQDNLAHVLPTVRLKGVYLGLLGRLNKEPPNVSKLGLAGDLQQTPEDLALRRRLSWALPFEMLSNGPGGSVTGYTDEGEPLRRVHPGEEAVYQKFTAIVQRAILSEVRALGEALKERAADGTDVDYLRRKGLAAWDSLLAAPAPALVTMLLELEHSETFGVGADIRYGTGVTWGLLARAPFSQAARTRLRVESAGLPWKAQLRNHPAVSPAMRAWLHIEPVACAIHKVFHPSRRWRQCT